MKNPSIICLALALFFNSAKLQANIPVAGIDYINAFKDTLNGLAADSDDEFFIMHCQSIIDVIESRNTLTAVDSGFIKDMYLAFNDESDTYSMRDFNSYINRGRSLIIAWISPTDGVTSFSWLKLPLDWNPVNEYPLYIQLHGLWDVANNPIEYLSYPFLRDPSTSVSFEDGYLLSPWGRGNLWYQGISETDIWECMAALEEIASINPARKYLSGHSMGGYGAWHIALNSANTWAALGVHAGALWYGSPGEVNAAAAETLKDLPTYFVCGTNDGLLSINQTAYNLLEAAGNTNIEFVTFTGGHEYLEENVLNMYLWMREFVNDDWNGIDTYTQEAVTSISCSPNPLSIEARINFNITSPGAVRIELFNQNGRPVQLLTNAFKPAGNHEIVWAPYKLPPGIYYCRLSSNALTETIKVIVK